MNKIFYKLEGHINTDADFHIDLKNMKDGDSLYNHEGFAKYINTDNDYEYDIALYTDDVFLVRDFLETLIVSFRVGSSHYWVLEDLYNMVDGILEILFNDEINFECKKVYGNYDGTELSLIKEVTHRDK